jgi:hypothetical protein
MPNNVECGSVKNSNRHTAYRVSVCAKTPTESVRFRYSALASSSNVALRYAVKRFLQCNPMGAIERVYVQQIKA